jgi:hypothetical protein
MTSESAALLSLLVAGHMLGDFVLQTQWMIARKHLASGLLAHVLVVAIAQLVLLIPFFGAAALMAVAAIAAAHLLLDVSKVALQRRDPSHALLWFFLDQALHLGVLAAAWMWLSPRTAELHPALDGIDPSALAAIGILLSAYAFNVNGMSVIVLGVLAPLGIAPSEGAMHQPTPRVGRVIGILERMFALTLILMNQWAALGLLVTAKSIARFKDLEERRLAEYYLVGTLVSLFGATVTALAARFFLESIKMTWLP